MKMILAGAICLTSCRTMKEPEVVYASAATICSKPIYSYNADIKSIIESSCLRCHNSNGVQGFDFSSIAGVKKAAESGALLGTIKHQSGYPGMPQGSAKLPQATIEKIECWINTGMKE